MIEVKEDNEKWRRTEILKNKRWDMFLKHYVEWYSLKHMWMHHSFDLPTRRANFQDFMIVYTGNPK